MRTLALATAFRAAVADRTGEQGGLAGLEVAVAAARDGGVAFAEAIAHGLTAQVLAVRGRDTEARAHLAAALGDGPAWWGAALSTSVAGAVVALAADDPAGMLAALEPVLRPEVLVLADGLGSFVPRVLHAEALLRGGDTVGAATALDALDGHLAERVPGRCALDAARLRGLLAEAAGRPDAARVALEDGLVLAEGMRAPLAVARTETELGRLLLTVGERRAGVDALRSALTAAPPGPGRGPVPRPDRATAARRRPHPGPRRGGPRADRSRGGGRRPRRVRAEQPRGRPRALRHPAHRGDAA